ncbi:MAG: dihydropteroate synthase [Holophaga sp.]
MPWQTSRTRFSLEEPLYLGILNLTPDSFSDGGAYLASADALTQTKKLVSMGVGVVDIGGESTRPGAQTVTTEEEWRRIEPALSTLGQAFPDLPLSLDSRHPQVASKALELGVTALNDVTGFSDPAMLQLALNSSCALIAMRSRIKDGQLEMPPYDDPTYRSAERAISELRHIKTRLLEAGVAAERILLDPGFGFGTTYREDTSLWEALPRLPEALDWPVDQFCLGLSRKRFLAVRAGRSELAPRQRDILTHEAHAEARTLGFKVFRTHTMPEARVRRAQPEDAGAIAAVHVASWRAAYKGMLPETFLASLSLVEKKNLALASIQQPESNAHRLLVLDRGGQILGFAAIGPTQNPDNDKVAEIYAIYLHPSAWGQGLGCLLLAKGLETLRQAGFTRATLWVLERNVRARAFYDAGGWIPDGKTRTQWHGGIAMRELGYCLGI